MSQAEVHLDPERGLSRRAKILAVTLSALGVAAALLITYLRSRPEVGSADFTFDPLSKVPQIPVDTPYSSSGNIIASICLLAVGLTGVGLSIRNYVKTKNALPIWLSLSGTMIAFPEVFFDLMGDVYYPWSEHSLAYTILGREMPWWVLTGWFGYGAFMFFEYKLLESRPKTKQLWMFWGMAAIGDLVFEELLLQLGVYHYYGNQPLLLSINMPWWWMPCNSAGVFLASSLAYRYRDRLKGWRGAAMILLTPMSVGAIYGFIAMPGWVVVNANYGWFITQLGGLAVIALGVTAFCLILNVVLRRRPFHPDSRGPEDLDTADSPMPLKETAPSAA
ncbi:hypothetical protein AB0L85_30395 [Streptomyces sp. NPDC052051]|uniref:hypothetical protein n=1 Tax=Streptomyces sp. NPDC052051 TaxID=3154649 RepID=UPI00341C793B